MSNVIDFLSRKNKKASEENFKKTELNTYFQNHLEQIVKRNKEAQERIKKERESANKNVIKSYKIK